MSEMYIVVWCKGVWTQHGYAVVHKDNRSKILLFAATHRLTQIDCDALNAAFAAGAASRDSQIKSAEEALESFRTARASALADANENAKFIVEHAGKHAIRVCEGGGPEDIQQSLAVTFMRITTFLAEREADCAVLARECEAWRTCHVSSDGPQARFAETLRAIDAARAATDTSAALTRHSERK